CRNICKARSLKTGGPYVSKILSPVSYYRRRSFPAGNECRSSPNVVADERLEAYRRRLGPNGASLGRCNSLCDAAQGSPRNARRGGNQARAGARFVGRI